MTVLASSALFLALDVGNPVGDHLIGLQSDVTEAHWVPRAGLHVTMRYLGVIPAEHQHDLRQRISGVNVPAFDMKVSGVGHFDLLDGAVALWAGVEPAPAMRALHDALDKIANDLGFMPPSRAWNPHISVGFRAQMAPSVERWKEDHENLDLPAVRVSGLGLFTSNKLPKSGGYERIASFPFSTISPEAEQDTRSAKISDMTLVAKPKPQTGTTS
jgi:RNA 2',3'-cyclic 3'-phosphodiesterase